MNRKTTKLLLTALFLSTFPMTLLAQTRNDSTRVAMTFTTDEVVVTGTRNETDIRHLPMSISVVNRKQISGRYEQSLLPLLTEQVPGLFVTGRGMMGYGVSTGAAGGMSLRGIGGSPTTGLLVLIDGHPQYMGLMGHPIADAYQSMLAEKVEVVRGPASVLYGSNAMGGVINIVTRKSQEDGIRNTARISYGSYNTLTTDVANQIRKGGFNSLITASYNRTDGHRANMEFEQYGGYAKVGYDFNSIWKTYADVNLTHFNASNPGMVTALLIDNNSRVTRGMTSFSLENDYGFTSGALKLFYNWGLHKINDGYSAGQSPKDYRFRSEDRMFGITWYQTASLFTGNRLTVGLDYQRMGGEAWNKYLDGSDKQLADKTESEIAGYVDFRQAFGQLFTLDAGVRADHHSKTGTEWIPQVGLSAYLLKNGELKAIVSKGFRNPTIRELYMFGSKNPDLLPEKLMNYELSWSHRLPDTGWSYGLNVYYIKGDNMIQTVGVENGMLNINTGKVENWGAEANVNYQINKAWTVSSNYSWLRMKYPLLASPEQKFYVGADYRSGRWSASTGIQYICGLRTDLKSDSKESFVLWNLRAGYRLCRVADLFVRGENLLAQSYQINPGFPMPRATFMGGINLKF